MFKLYPWEWMFDEDFGSGAGLAGGARSSPPENAAPNKGMLALAWDMAPGHPNLLPCYFEDDKRAAGLGAHYARKPLYSREGGNIELHDGASTLLGPDLAYRGARHVRQALCRLPEFEQLSGARLLAGRGRAGGHGPARGRLADHLEPFSASFRMRSWTERVTADRRTGLAGSSLFPQAARDGSRRSAAPRRRD